MEILDHLNAIHDTLEAVQQSVARVTHKVMDLEDSCTTAPSAREKRLEITLSGLIREPVPQQSTHGPSLLCPSCSYWWLVGGKEYHSISCASEIARAALALAQGGGE